MTTFIISNIVVALVWALCWWMFWMHASAADASFKHMAKYRGMGLPESGLYGFKERRRYHLRWTRNWGASVIGLFVLWAYADAMALQDMGYL